MKCIIYTTAATSKLLFTLGCKITQRAIELELKVPVLSYNSCNNSIWRERKQMLCEYHSDTTTVHLHALSAGGLQPPALIHSNMTTSLINIGFIHITVNNNSCFFFCEMSLCVWQAICKYYKVSYICSYPLPPL